MKKIIESSILGLLILSIIGMLFIGHPIKPLQTQKPDVIVECLVQSLDPYVNLWRDETARRFNHAVVVEVHGGDFVEGQWIVGAGYTPWRHVTPVEEIITRYRALYPDRELVLVCCNTGHIILHGFPHVWYADSSVWVVPDRMMTQELVDSGIANLKVGFTFNEFDGYDAAPIPRSVSDPDTRGNIYEFISAE